MDFNPETQADTFEALLARMAARGSWPQVCADCGNLILEPPPGQRIRHECPRVAPPSPPASEPAWTNEPYRTRGDDREITDFRAKAAGERDD
jgi:hypothetical protein